MEQRIDSRIRLPFGYREVTLEQFQDYYGKYNEILNVEEQSKKSIKDLEIEMEHAKVDFGVIHAEYEFGENAQLLNEKVAEVVLASKGKFKGFGTINLERLQPMDMIETVHQIRELGLAGINLQPPFFNVNPLDRRLYPIYATAHSLGLIVSFHTGIHYSLTNTLEHSNPIYLDTIAVDFPGLKMIACHSGWPWIPEILAITRRHANIFLDFGGISPKYIQQEHSGWEEIFHTMNNLLKRQILFATDWPVIPMEQSVRMWEESSLKEDTLQHLFYENANNLFKFV